MGQINFADLTADQIEGLAKKLKEKRQTEK